MTASTQADLTSLGWWRWVTGVSRLHFEAVDDATLEKWRHVHNVIIPADPLSLEDVRERRQRFHLELGYVGDVLAGCSTVRPPMDDAGKATVIVRVLPEHRRQGIGGEFFQRELEHARAMGGKVIETVVLESNQDGLRFALSHGFVEIERYVLPGHAVPFIDLRLT
ncbi:GNAT family N-acetyltransferase [Streptosporangium sp. 'caverna']|nr:GNAT family N-acetyltransferase [Streptosporangium sp. 'caverna']